MYVYTIFTVCALLWMASTLNVKYFALYLCFSLSLFLFSSLAVSTNQQRISLSITHKISVLTNIFYKSLTCFGYMLYTSVSSLQICTIENTMVFGSEFNFNKLKCFPICLLLRLHACLLLFIILISIIKSCCISASNVHALST